MVFLSLVTLCLDIVSKQKQCSSRKHKGNLEESIAWTACWLMLLSLFMCTHALFIYVSFFLFFCLVHFVLTCSASLFSLAIHCLTAEVFFQPFKSCTLKFPAKDNQVCILLSLPALSLCTLSSSPGCLAAPPLGLSLLHTMSHQLSSSRGNWQGGEILNLQNFCFTPLWC